MRNLAQMLLIKGKVLMSEIYCIFLVSQIHSVVVSLVSIKGTECRIVELGQVASQTGGQVCVRACVHMCVCVTNGRETLGGPTCRVLALPRWISA